MWLNHICSALTNQILFPAKDWLLQKIACKKEHLETQMMLCLKYDFVVIADYFCTTLPNKKTVMKNFVESAMDWMVLQHISIDKYFPWCHLNMLHTHMLCMFYFITDGYQNSMFCSLTSIPRWDYEKSYQSQAYPSGQIQGQYSRRSVATRV